MSCVNKLQLLFAAGLLAILSCSKTLAIDQTNPANLNYVTDKSIAVASAASVTDKVKTRITITPNNRVNESAEKYLNGLYGWQPIQQIELESVISSKSTKPGDMVGARLMEDLRFGSRLIAAKSSVVLGHIVDTKSSRRMITAILSQDRRLKSRGCITIQFDQIINSNGVSLPIRGTPCRYKDVSHVTKSSARMVQVDGEGRVVRAEPVLRGGLEAASVTTRVVSNLPLPGNFVLGEIAGPFIMCTASAISPAIAYDRPLEPEENNSRLKAAAYGFVTGLPGAPLVQKGNDVVIRPGDLMEISIHFQRTD